jgi:DNA-binding CsgD family transcriptional regulator
MIVLYHKPRELLSPRECQLVALIEEGACRTKILAGMMGITDCGLRQKLNRVYAKLRNAGYAVDSLASLAVWCFKPGALQRGKAA